MRRARGALAFSGPGRRRAAARAVLTAAPILHALACAPASAPGSDAGAPQPAPLDALDDDGRRWVDETLRSLALDEAVAQLVFPWIPGGYASADDPEFEELLDWVDRGLGGVSISIGTPDGYVAKLNRLQARATVPLLVASDFENGGPGMRINHSYAIPSLLPQGGGTSFPPTMAFGAAGGERLAYEYGRVTAREARAVGVHWIFAPVLDVNSNPENPVINVRSFGEDAEAVGRLGAAFVRGVRAGGALSTAKHFPGHGDTRLDSHVALPVIPADRERLDRIELAPFRMAIAAGVDAVMTAHVAVPGVVGDERPATMAPELMTDLLRRDMGFDGILFTDALRMGAVQAGYGAGEAAVQALEAGADVLLAPDGIAATVAAVREAVRSGRLDRARIDRSVGRLLEAKARLGLHRDGGARVDPDAVARVVGSAEHRAVAERAASASMTLVRDRRGVLPLAPSANVLSVTWARADDLLAGRTFDAVLRSRVAAAASARVGPGTPWATYDSLLHAARGVDAVVVGAYASPRSGAGSVGASPDFAAFVRRLDVVVAGRVAAISFGSPYALSAFPDVGAYMAAWGGWETSQRAAARAATGAAAVRGRLPISIPPLHALGDGLDLDAVAAATARADVAVDPLAEAGFAPAAGEARATAEGSERDAEPTGGPGRWRPEPPWPECADVEAHAGPETPTEDVFCRLGGAIRSVMEVDADRVGMSEDSLARLDRFVLDALADSAASGAALAVVRRGRLVRLRGYGRLDWDVRAPAVTPASVFDLASLTKVVATTSAVVLLAQRGRLDLDDRVVDRLPWWGAGDARKREVTLRHLLLHRAGLPPFRRFFLEMAGRDAYEDAIAALPLDTVPGAATVYSDIGLMTAAFVVEAVSGEPLDAFARRELWAPLGMADTGFRPPASEWRRVATTEMDSTYRGFHVHGVAHDENAYAIGGVAGHAGLFSSARDLAVFAQTMLDRGVAAPCRADADSGAPCHRPRFSPVSIFAQGWVERTTRRASSASSRAHGWDTPSARSSAGDYFSARSFGHTGYTGTSLWVDPTQGLAVVLLTNRVNPTRENGRHVALRRGVHDRVALAIVDTPPPPRPGAGESHRPR